MFWVIDLIVNIRHYLQGATQWWNRLPVIRENTTRTMINNSGFINLIYEESLSVILQTSSRGSNYHEAMMTLRDSSTSPAVSLCWGSNTSSFRIRHTVFSDTRPSLWGGGGKQEGKVLFAKCDCKSHVHKATVERSLWKYTVVSVCFQLAVTAVKAAKIPLILINLLHLSHVQDEYSLWDGVLSSLDLAEELLRYAVIKGELAIQHGEQDHAKSPHIAGFATVRPTWGQEDEEISEIIKYGIWNGDSKVLFHAPVSDKP